MTFSIAIDDLTLAGLKRGSRRHQGQVYQTYSTAAWTLALRLSGCESKAWDAVHSAFLKVFERADQLRDSEQFGFWLRRIVINQVMDGFRRDTSLALIDVTEWDAAVEDHPDLTRDLEGALARLSAWDRSVLWLHDVEGLTHAEIAHTLQQSVPWSKTRLSRARASMRAWLYDHAPNGHEPEHDKQVSHHEP